MTMTTPKNIKLNRKCEEHYHETDVDIKIAPLIKNIWEADIETSDSFESRLGAENYICITFLSGSDFEKFISILCDVDSKIKDETLYEDFMYEDLTFEKEGNKPFMVIYTTKDKNFIFKDCEKEFQKEFVNAKRPIIDIKIATDLFIRSDLIKLVTKKIELYNKIKFQKKEKIGFFCDCKGGYVYGTE